MRASLHSHLTPAQVWEPAALVWEVRPEGGTLLRDGCVFQPPKEEKIEDKGHSGLTTLFPGQKRRISHLSKQGKEVRVCFGS